MTVRISYNKTYKKQNTKLISATFKKGIISAIYPNLFAADVYFVGNSQTIIQKIPFASTVNLSNVKQGDKCRVDLFDETNPNDMVISYTYGRSPKNVLTGYNSGTGACSTTTGNVVPHGLGAIPDIISITLGQSGTIYQYAPADATNLYIKSIAIFPSTTAFYWYVIKF